MILMANEIQRQKQTSNGSRQRKEVLREVKENTEVHSLYEKFGTVLQRFLN